MRANWINCLLYKVLINVNIFLVLNKNCTEPHLVRYKEATIFILMNSSFNFLSVKSLKEFSSLEQYQYADGFQRLHTGVKLRSSVCLSFLISSFECLHNTRFVFRTKKSHNSTITAFRRISFSRRISLSPQNNHWLCQTRNSLLKFSAQDSEQDCEIYLKSAAHITMIHDLFIYFIFKFFKTDPRFPIPESQSPILLLHPRS